MLLYLVIRAFINTIYISFTYNDEHKVESLSNPRTSEASLTREEKIIIIKFTPKVCYTKVANGTMITLWIPFLTHESLLSSYTQSF